MAFSILESYDHYQPPIPLKPIIQDLLGCVPADSLQDLGAILLTNAEPFNVSDTAETSPHPKRKASSKASTGQYWPARADREAYIELYVDSILGPKRKAAAWIPRLLLRPNFRRLALRQKIGCPLFFMIGQHAHFALRTDDSYDEKAVSRHFRTYAFRFVRRHFLLYVIMTIALLFTPRCWRYMYVAQRYSRNIVDRSQSRTRS